MTRSIAEWQKAAHELARENGEHSRMCQMCQGAGCICDRVRPIHQGCIDGRVEVDHKSPTRIASRLAMIHLAISHAVECVVKGRMRLGYMDGSIFRSHGDAASWFEEVRIEPEGFGLELADVFLRLCDLAESIGVRLLGPGMLAGAVAWTAEENLAELCALHSFATHPHDLMWGHLYTWDAEEMRSSLSVLLHHIFLISSVNSIDLLAMAELKYAYNKTQKAGRP